MSTPAAERPSEALRKPTPGALYPWVKRVSYIELAVFAALIFFWLAPGFDDETFAFGLAHGLGYIALCIVIWIAVIRREVGYSLLGATLTPVGPVGSVIAIEYTERKRAAEPDARASARQRGEDDALLLGAVGGGVAL